jgi:hypothetical protein
MMTLPLRTWIQKLLRGRHPGSHRRPTRRRPAPSLVLEQLEDRLVPAQIYFADPKDTWLTPP